MFPEAPRPLVSVNSKEFYPLAPGPFVVKGRGPHRWVPGLVPGHKVWDTPVVASVSEDRPPFMNGYSPSPKESPLGARWPDPVGRGAAGWFWGSELGLRGRH